MKSYWGPAALGRPFWPGVELTPSLFPLSRTIQPFLILFFTLLRVKFIILFFEMASSASTKQTMPAIKREPYFETSVAKKLKPETKKVIHVDDDSDDDSDMDDFIGEDEDSEDEDELVIILFICFCNRALNKIISIFTTILW